HPMGNSDSFFRSGRAGASSRSIDRAPTPYTSPAASFRDPDDGNGSLDHREPLVSIFPFARRSYPQQLP
ncbi:MAG: hypothetical protein ACK523_10430, partial [Pirellulaceae bacterium]